MDDVFDIVSEYAPGTWEDAGGIDLVHASVSHTLSAFVEKLNLTGIGVIDATGNDLANRITGNNANNLIDGGAGLDVLTGRGGADTFIFRDFGPKDRVTDFARGTDKLGFDAGMLGLSVGSGLDGDGNLDADWLEMGAAATKSHAQFFYDAGRASLFWDSDGAGGAAAAAVAKLTGVSELDTADFAFV